MANEHPYENAEDDCWYDSRGPIANPTIGLIIDGDGTFHRFDFSGVKLYEPFGLEAIMHGDLASATGND